jgi:hypothetical protein
MVQLRELEAMDLDREIGGEGDRIEAITSADFKNPCLSGQHRTESAHSGKHRQLLRMGLFEDQRAVTDTVRSRPKFRYVR